MGRREKEGSRRGGVMRGREKMAGEGEREVLEEGQGDRERERKVKGKHCKSGLLLAAEEAINQWV